MRVLLIDDDADLCAIASLSLTALGGMEVTTAGSGPEGIASALACRPNAIILDVMMPEMDGRQTLAALKTHRELDGVQIVFLTAVADSKSVADLAELSGNPVLRKPFEPQHLVDSINKIVNSSK